MKRMSRTSHCLVPFALGATGLFALFLTGCSKQQEAAKPVDPSSPASYMKDPAFRAKLDASVKERKALTGTRVKLVEQMKAKVDEAKRRLGTSDEKLVKAELEKDPEWKSLYARCEEATTALREQSRKTQATVRERIAPKKPISK